MFENIEKAFPSMLLAIGVKKRSVWMKPWSQNRLRKIVYQNIFQELLQERLRRNTNLTKNIVMAAPVIMNSTLDNAGVQDQFI